MEDDEGAAWSPKTLPPVSTHQYKTRLRRILSAFRIITHRNAETQSSTLQPQPEYHLDPNLDPNPNPNSDPKPNPNPNPDSPYNPNPNPYPDLLHETLPTILNLDSHGKPLSHSSAKSGPDRHFWLIAEAEEICRLIFSDTLPFHYAATSCSEARNGTTTAP